MKVTDLLGKTITEIKGGPGDGVMLLKTSDGKKYQFYHSQDCCESVSIDDVVGDLNDLLGEPLLEADEAESNEDPGDLYNDGCYAWTFYKLGTRKGSVTVRWYGTSNGYYSVSVDLEEVK